MWHLMVFADQARTMPVKVMTFETVNEIAYVVGLPSKTIYNFFHRLIHPRGSLKYVSLFKV
eukprot:COSAG04_NODE_370_length_15729_cov_5.743506_12_plen_61_part_00